MMNNFSFEDRAVYELMWTDRPQMTIWRMRFALYVPKTTITHSEHVILIPFPQQQWLHERASLLRYMTTARFLRKKSF